MLLEFGLVAARGASLIGHDQRHFSAIIDASEWYALNDRLLTPSERANGSPLRPDSTDRSSGGADKGNLKLLQGVTGKRKDLVTFDTAAKFGGVTKRAIEKAAAKGSLKAVGSSRNRRISVPSLLEYFPPENNTN